MEALRIEFQKTRYRKIWLSVLLLIGVQIMWGLWSINKMDAKDLEQGFMYCLYQFPLLNTILMPIVVAVIASRLCDIEHKGGMLKLLYTIMPSSKLFLAKFLCGSFYVIMAALLQTIVIIIFGVVKGFGGGVPMDKMFFYFIFTIAVSLTILLFQQVLSIAFINQMIPITIGLAGSFIGLFTLFFPQDFKKLVVWGYYGVMALVTMNWDKDTRITDFSYQTPDWFGLLLLGIMFTIIYSVGVMLGKRREI